MRIRLAVAAFVNSGLHKCASKYGNRDPPNKHGLIYFYQSPVTYKSFCVGSKK